MLCGLIRGLLFDWLLILWTPPLLAIPLSLLFR